MSVRFVQPAIPPIENPGQPIPIGGGIPSSSQPFPNPPNYNPATGSGVSRKKGDIHQIRDQQFYIEILMYNQIQGEEPLFVPFFFVDSLIINESLQNWATTAEITFNTDFELFSRGSPNDLKLKDKTISKIKAPYIDRTDGRNRISIQIIPINDYDNYDEKIWGISHDFVVTDIQDLDVPNSQRKKRKYILVDERYQILSEKNLEWSTRLLMARHLQKLPWQMTDDESAMNPNYALQWLLAMVGINQITGEQVNIGFDSAGSINTPNVPFYNIDAFNWSVGNADLNKILYYSPANATALDDLYYILAHCQGNDFGPVILDLGRSLSDKRWKLQSISDICKNASNLQVERLFIEDSSSPENTTPPVPRADTDTNTSKNFTSSVASRIQRYKFVPMVASDDSRIINSPLHVFDFATNQWNIFSSENTAEQVEDQLDKYAKMGLYSHQKGINPQILLSLNKTKTEGIMRKHEQASSKYVPTNAPRNQMLLDALFLNQAISFQTLGLTNRSPGRFCYIDRISSGDANPFDDRFLGQWLMTKVSHLFTHGTYVTEVVANKFDAFNKVFPVFDSGW